MKLTALDRLVPGLLLLACLAASAWSAEPPQLTSPRHAIVGGKVVTVTGAVLDGGVVLVSAGRIEALLDREMPGSVPDGYERIDATGRWVVPGFIELHSHIAGGDLNDMVYPVNSGFRTIDNVMPGNALLARAQAGGVTTALFIPGSGTNLSGFGTIVKTAAVSSDGAPESLVMRFPGALKIAQGGNPERRGGDLGSTPVGMNWLIRQGLAEGRAYHRAWEAFERGESKEAPTKNPRLELFRGLFRRDYPVVVHTQGYHLVLSTLRILHDEMKLWVVIDHGTFDGHELAGEVARRGIQVMNGPRQLRFDNRRGSIRGLASEWHRGGVEGIGVNTDAPVVPAEELIVQASMAVRLGLDPEVALRGLTIHAARALGIDDAVGSLEVGKEADIVIWTDDPVDPRSSVVLTMVRGNVAYDTRRHPQRF